MNLRRFEIDAILKKVSDTLRSRIEIPSFENEIEERKKLIKKYNKYVDKIAKINQEFKEFRNDNGFNVYSSGYSDIDKELQRHKKSLEINFVTNKMPNIKDIENDIILSGNKDLAALVDELIEKYSN